MSDELPEYPSYNDLVRTFGTILFEYSDGEYQGDTRMLITDGSRYGVLTFGWGSCSGCDALQMAESNRTELLELRDQLARGVHWEPTAAELIAYIEGKDWSLDYMDMSEDVVRSMVEVLRAQP